MTGSMTFTIPLPNPGDVSTHDLGDALTVLIENTADSREAGKPAVTPTISYTVVDVAGATRVHAAVVKHHSQRSVVSRSTMCKRDQGSPRHPSPSRPRPERRDLSAVPWKAAEARCSHELSCGSALYLDLPYLLPGSHRTNATWACPPTGWGTRSARTTSRSSSENYPISTSDRLRSKETRQCSVPRSVWA